MKSEFQTDTKRSEEKANRLLLRISVIIGMVGAVTYIFLVFLLVLQPMVIGWRIATIAIAVLHLIIGVALALYLEYKAGYYECPECGTRYVPKVSTFLLSPHMGFRRKLTCPKCGERKYSKKVMTK